MAGQGNVPARPKKVWREIDGVLLLDKPQGLTSNDALQKARRLFSAAKGGHTGTLDPMATGLLPLCFGEATKFSADLLEADKTYETTLRLGVTTDSADAEGQVLEIRPVTCSLAEVDAAIQRFLGDILQVPPMHSALKRDGRPLYELARQGISVERAARPVHIAGIARLGDLVPLADVHGAGFSVTLRVTCSKGTYIRVLGQDIGAALGCGAHLTMLRRIQVGRLTLQGAVTLAELEALEEPARMPCLQAVDSLLTDLAPVTLDEPATLRFAHGNPVDGLPDSVSGQAWRVYDLHGCLLGVGETDERNRLWPKRLLKQKKEA